MTIFSCFRNSHGYCSRCRSRNYHWNLPARTFTGYSQKVNISVINKLVFPKIVFERVLNVLIKQFPLSIGEEYEINLNGDISLLRKNYSNTKPFLNVTIITSVISFSDEVGSLVAENTRNT